MERCLLCLLFCSPFSKEIPQGIVGLFKDRTASWWSRLSWFAFPSTFSLYSLNIFVTWFVLFAGSFLRRLNLLHLRWNTCQHLCLSLEITQFLVPQKTSPSGSVSAIVIQRISPIIHHVCPLTFCITGPFFFSFLLAIAVVKRNWRRCLCKRLEGREVYYGRCAIKNKLLNSLCQIVAFWDLCTELIDRRRCMFNKYNPWQRYTIK